MADQPTRILARHMLSPIPLLIAVAAFVAAVTQHPTVAIAALALWLIVAAARLHTVFSAPEPKGVIHLQDAPAELKKTYVVLTETLEQIRAAAERLPPEVAPMLRPLQEELQALAQSTKHLLEQQYAWWRHLETSPLPLQQARRESLSSQLASATDEATRQQLQAALTSVESQIAQTEQLKQAYASNEAALLNLQTSLEALAASVLMLSADAGEVASGEQQAVLERLGAARSTVSAAEEITRQTQTV